MSVAIEESEVLSIFSSGENIIPESIYKDINIVHEKLDLDIASEVIESIGGKTHL